MIEIIVVFLLFVLLFLIFICIFSKYSQVETTNIIEVSDCTVDESKLPDISNDKCCKNTTEKMYSTSDSSIMILSSTSMGYLSICENFCLNGMTPNNKCLYNVGQNEFEECVVVSSCNSVTKPVAISKGVLYYLKIYSDTECELEDCNS